MIDKKELGSQTARGGFLNEAMVCEKFLNYKNDPDSALWLKEMGQKRWGMKQKIYKAY